MNKSDAIKIQDPSKQISPNPKTKNSKSAICALTLHIEILIR